MSDEFEDQLNKIHDKQQKERDADAYKTGKARHDADQADPANTGSPGGDGYGGMSPSEKDSYKKGFRGE